MKRSSRDFTLDNLATELKHRIKEGEPNGDIGIPGLQEALKLVNLVRMAVAK